MMYLVDSERSSRLPVENPSGISEEESFRFQPFLRSDEILISLGQDHSAGSEPGDNNQRSLHNCGIVRSKVGADARDCSLSASVGAGLGGAFIEPAAHYTTKLLFAQLTSVSQACDGGATTRAPHG
jgi:hypothetical protein